MVKAERNFKKERSVKSSHFEVSVLLRLHDVGNSKKIFTPLISSRSFTLPFDTLQYLSVKTIELVLYVNHDLLYDWE